MALPTSTNNVTVRKLSSTLQGIWNKIATALGGKADKVSGATNNNFAGLDSNGNLKDSGKKASDFATSAQGTKADSAIQGIKVNGTAQTPDTNKVVDITKTSLGLNNVTNDAQVKRTEMGAANGVATLDANGKIPTSQIPGSYDDVKEGYLYNGKFYTDSEHTTEIPASGDKVYVDIPTNKTYRWSGTQYVLIASDLALGETSSTAYRGDRGKTAYDHSQLTSGNPHNVTKSDVGLGSVVNTGDSATPVSGGTTKFTTGGAFTELNKKVDKTAGVTGVTWDSTNSKLTKTINGTTTDVVTASTLKSAMSLNNVDNKSEATIKSDFTGAVADGNTGFPTGDAVYDAIAANGKGVAFVDVENGPNNSLVGPSASDVQGLVDAGKVVIARYNGRYFSLFIHEEHKSTYYFVTINYDGSGYCLRLATDGWTCTDTSTELLSNKVDSWSSTTTDVHYPSEKLVKDSLDNKVDKVTGKGLSTNDYTTTEKNKLEGISANAKKVEASSTNGNIKIDGTETTVYSHPTTSGNKHVPSGGSSGQFLGWSADGTAAWVSNPASAITTPKLGFGYAGSTTNSSAAFSAAVSNFVLCTNGIVVVKFSAAVPASATLNVNSTGAKTIRWKGATITADVIQSGDTGTFAYDGTYWNLVAVDRSCKEMTDQEVTDLVNALI